MTQRIEKDFLFDTAIHFENGFYINQYQITLSMLVNTDVIKEHNTALERINYFISHRIQSSLFIEENETEAIQKYKAAGINICTLPDEPHDQIISMVLLTKFNALTENKLIITDLILGSTFSEGVKFHTVSEIAEDIIDQHSSKWWNCATICMEDSKLENSGEDHKIIELFSDDAWEKLDLGFSKKGKKANQKLDHNT